MLGNPYGKRDAMLGSKDIKNWEARKANQTTILPSKIIKKLSGQEAISKSGRLKRNFRQAVNFKYPTLQKSKNFRQYIPLCEFKSVLIYTWIAKPFVLPLQIFGNTKMKNKKWPYTIKAERKSAILSPTGGSRRRQ